MVKDLLLVFWLHWEKQLGEGIKPKRLILQGWRVGGRDCHRAADRDPPGEFPSCESQKWAQGSQDFIHLPVFSSLLPSDLPSQQHSSCRSAAGRLRQRAFSRAQRVEAKAADSWDMDCA